MGEEYRRVVGVEPALKINRADETVRVIPASAQMHHIEAARPVFESELEGLEWRAMLAGSAVARGGMSPVLGNPNGA